MNVFAFFSLVTCYAELNGRVRPRADLLQVEAEAISRKIEQGIDQKFPKRSRFRWRRFRRCVAEFSRTKRFLMYIPRIVIDANRINATGKLEGMNRLEELHKRGLVEIQATTTLSAELKGPFRIEKSKSYRVIGGSSCFSMNGVMISMPGAPIHLSYAAPEILRAVIKDKGSLAYTDDNTHRDVQHILQAWQNHSDYFVTNEKKLREAAPILRRSGIDIKICDDVECVQLVDTFFQRLYQTSDLENLSRIREKMHPITLGANDCYNFLLSDFNVPILQLDIADGHLKVAANIFDQDGSLQLEIRPGIKTNFKGRLGKVCGFGKGPITVGTESFSSFCIYLNEKCVLAAALLSSGVAQFNYAALNNSVGKPILKIDRDLKEIFGLAMLNTQWV